tara:strand:- start:1301 stop:2809 length:1509 start_codon:yes stop_codon:yes gene_type:complete
MVIRKNMNIKYALISVYDKSNLENLCKNLKKNNYKFISTGSTCKKIKSLGFDCLEISKLTKFKEILDGRVKTLNHKLFGSILFKRDDKKNLREFKNLKMPMIDIVIVNLYPFSKFIKHNDQSKILEMIDIGGPSLIRASSKNFKYITTICHKKYYKGLITNLNKNNGVTDLLFRKKMAEKTFELTSKYDSIIYKWLSNREDSKKTRLRYGENPSQKSYIERNGLQSIFDLQINGKQISYNNIIDVDNGLKCIREFDEPTCIIVKHNNPCGAGCSVNLETAFKKAFIADSKSAFGGIVFFNRRVSAKLAKYLSKIFLEVIVAPSFEYEAIKLLSKKKNLILLETNKFKIPNIEFKSTLFGTIYQSIDNIKINRKFFKLVSHKKVSKKILDDLMFSAKIAKHLKSNAIVLSKNKQTIGLGAGQTNRFDSLNIALKRKKDNFGTKDFVCVSDGFFPFTDSLKILNKNKCRVVAQPFGSINDDKNIEYANSNNISLYFMKNRLFKH